MLRRGQPGTSTKKLARERIDGLWRLSMSEARERPELARQWTLAARRIAQKARVRLPLEMKRSTCRACGGILTAGSGSRVRLRGSRSRHLIVTCLRCGTIRRYRVRREG